MIEVESLKAPRWQAFIGSLIAIVIVVLIGWYVGLHGLSYKAIIICLFGILGVVVVLAGNRGLFLGFVFWVWTLGLGYRAFPLNASLRIHPAEVGLWGLLALCVGQHSLRHGERLGFWLPRWLWLFIPFWLWGWVPGLWVGRPWGEMFAEFRNFLLLIPLFGIAVPVLSGTAYWRPVLLAFYATGTWIAVIGLLEYFWPGIEMYSMGFITNPLPVPTAGQGFLRARFSFWGGSVATFVCLLAAPLVVIVWHWWSGPWQRGIALLALTLQVTGIYIGGYRSVWFLMGIMFTVWALMRWGAFVMPLSLIPVLGGYMLLPGSAQERVLSPLLILKGRPVDSSVATRWDRAVEALNVSLRHPWGEGWAGAGWVHSDFLQVAANLGVLAGLLFASAYLVTLLRLWRRVRSCPRGDENAPLGFALLLCFISVGGLLAVQSIVVLPQLVLPAWFVWVLAECWLRQSSRGR